MLNPELEVMATWGSRPKKAAKRVADYKLAHGKIDDSFKTDLQRWYNEDKGQAILEDLIEIVGKLARSLT